jgi:Secretion system C-terminal sorting domain
MKKSSIFAIAFSTILSFNTISADNIRNTYNLNGTTVSITAQSKSIVVYLNDQKAETVDIQITDNNGSVLVNEAIAVSKRYTLDRLPMGQYKMTVARKNAKTVQPFEITNKGVVIEEAKKKAYFSPVIAQKGGHLQINALTPEYTNITVSIANANGKTIFEDKNYVVFNMHKSYNISQLDKGSYKVTIQAGSEVYTENFEKE